MNTAIELPSAMSSLIAHMGKKKNTDYVKKTFDAKPKNAELLEKAKQAGIEMGDVVNAALDKAGVAVLRDLLATRSKTISEISEQLTEEIRNTRGKAPGIR